MTEGQEKVEGECDMAEVCGSGKGAGFDGWRSEFRQKLASACKEKLYSFADLAIFLRSSIDVVNRSVKFKRKNLSDGISMIPSARSEGLRSLFSRMFSGARIKKYDELGSSDWRMNPRYRMTSLLENMARIIDENIGCEPGELCRKLFDCEERFRREDECLGNDAMVCDGGREFLERSGTLKFFRDNDLLTDYRGFLKKIGFFKLLRDAVTVEYLDNEPTVVLALVSLFGSKALDVIGLVK